MINGGVNRKMALDIPKWKCRTHNADANDDDVLQANYWMVRFPQQEVL